MTPWWGTLSWETARASGFVAYELVTLAVGLGMALSLRWQSTRWPRLLTNDAHQYLLLLAGAFTAIHGMAVWIDPFTVFKAVEVLLPGVSHYRPLWIGFGIVAAYLGLAVMLSTWLRPRIGYAWWRRLHVLGFFVWLLATAHGIGTGSDTRTVWAVLIYGISTALVATLLAIRLLKPVGRVGRRHPLGVASLAAVVGLGTLGTAQWPLSPGWNAIANNGHGSGARIALSPTQVPVLLHHALASNFTGSLTVQGPDDRSRISIAIQAQLPGASNSVLTVQMQGIEEQGGIALAGSLVTLATSGGHTLLQGTISQTSGSQLQVAARTATGAAWTMRIDLQIDPQQSVASGQLEAHPVRG